MNKKIFAIIVISWAIAALGLDSVRAATLEQVFQAAVQKNENILQETEHVIQAEEQLEQAHSTMYPSLYLRGTHFIQGEVDDPIAKQFSPESQTTTSLTLVKPLFRGFREYAVRRQRKILLTVGQYQRVSVLLKTYQEVATNYLNILSIEQDLKNLAEQQQLYGDRVKELQARIRRGESNATEALTAQSTEASLEAEVQMVRASLAVARERLNALTALPPETILQETDAESVPNPSYLKPLSEYLARAEERPDVQVARQKLEAASEEISVAKGGHWPSVDVEGNYYLSRPSGFLSEVPWDVKFSLSMPLFEGGLRFSETREAASKHREADLELARLRRQAQGEIKSFYEGLRLRLNQLTALKRSAELAEKNYQVLQRDYRRGLTRNIDVQLGLTEYRVSRRLYDQSRYLARLDLIKLESAAAILPTSLMKEM